VRSSGCYDPAEPHESRDSARGITRYVGKAQVTAMAADEPQAFGKLLRCYRLAAGLTQQALAEQAGLSARGIADLERGARRFPYKDTAERLVEALGLGNSERIALLGTRRPTGTRLPAAPASALRSAALPTGTVTFLFTGVEGSTRLLERFPTAYPAALARQATLVRGAIEAYGGVIFETVGDAVYAAFPRAADAVAAAREAQLALEAKPWGEVGAIRVRMGLHTGEVERRGDHYFGVALDCGAQLMALAQGGQVLLSGATAELVRSALPAGADLRDLGVRRLKDLAQPEHIYQLLHPDLPSEFPPLGVLDALPNNLPLQVTSFIGREKELAEVKRLLETTRLLTLTGAGGVGKTRLALHAAAEALPRFTEGVWLAELAALADPALVPQAVATAVGIREEPGRSLLATLSEALRPKHLLLVLDNCEHLVEACARLADSLLRTCPQLQVLATSREPLGIAGEAPWRVPSLGLLDAQDGRPLPPTPQVAQVEAVRLFVERAVSAQPGFALTDQNARAVAQICQRLDGIPLALELAAARVRVVPVEQLLGRLSDRFRLLTGGSRTALARHQTLRATVDWSYDLLSPDERRLFNRLSVFAGGFTLEAAEAVCSGEDVALEGVLELLTHLVDKSLVVVEGAPDGTARYRLLDTLRQYGWQRLVDSRESEAIRRAHAGCYLALAEEAEPELTGAGQQAWLERLERDHDNLRVALVWAVEREEAETGLRLGGALGRFWMVRGYLSEGRQRLAAGLALAGASGRTAVRARALDMAGWLASPQGDYPAARALLQESLAICQELGHKRGTAFALYGLGLAAWNQGDYGAARALYEESLAICQELGDKQGIAEALNGLGIVAWNQGDYPAARALAEESLAICRELGDKWGIAFALRGLGLVAWGQGDHAVARALLQESLAIYRQLGHKRGTAFALTGLGRVAADQGDYPTARARSKEGLALFQALGNQWGIAEALTSLGDVLRQQGDLGQAAALYEETLAVARARGLQAHVAWAQHGLGHVALRAQHPRQARTCFAESLARFCAQESKRGIAYCVAGLAGVAAAEGQLARAARLFGAAQGLLEAMGVVVPLAERAASGHDCNMAAVRAALGEASFAAAWAAGQALPLERAIAEALEAVADSPFPV
jgi:predicted ATPase/class 3 adenylate cyclase